MKIITVSGIEPIPIEYRIKYLKKKGIKFYVYALTDSDEDNAYWIIDAKDGQLQETSDWDVVLSEKYLGENPSFTTAQNYDIHFDMRHLRRDVDFIEIVESGTGCMGGLEVVEIKDGERFKISSQYDGYNGEIYEIIEIFNESDWELAK